MRTWILVAVVGVVAGCGPEAPYEYGKPLGLDVRSVAPLDEAEVTRAVAVARTMMREGAPRLRPGEFEIAFAALEVVIRDEVHWNTQLGREIVGYTQYVPLRVEVGRDMRGLLHELLHVWEIKQGAMGTTTHDDWDARGFRVADEAYRRALVPPAQ